ncbi:transcription termination factor 2-like isoform X1 [Branchiostoma floridae x Branchiostoma belcheri]
MDVVLCQGHGKPCMLKTGVREGPNKGKSFYMCSQMPQSCGFTTPASPPPFVCLKHAGKTIELQKTRDKENQLWLCYRCQVTKDATKGEGWCGKILYTIPPETTSDSDSSDSEEYEDADGGKKLMTQIEDIEKAIKSIDLGASQSQPQGASGGHGRQQQPSKHQPQGDRHVLPTHAQPLPAHVLQQMYAPHPQGQTLYGGRMTATRLQQVAGVTSEAIERLHKSLESCPPPDAEVEDPACLRVSLLTHQRQALAWLTWREGQHPSGGILADDMGLGKTLTMISLILTQRQNTGARNKTKAPVPEGVVKSGATLVVCPASLILHWKAEVERHTEEDTLRVYLYHGQNRTKDHTELAEYDLVLSTYELVRKECYSWAADQPTQEEKKENRDDTAAPRGPMPVLLRVIWDRIILDEAHTIKNHKSQTSVAACQLRAHSRWAMTGTPIQNDLMDMYPLLRFMRCSPFDEMKVWKKWVDNKTANGKARLNTLVNSLLLRRTKGQEGRDGRPLVSLPQCIRISHVIKLSDDERAVYDKFYQDTRKTFQNYLLQHGEKENVKDRVPPSSVGTVQTAPAGDHKTATGQHQNVPGVQQNVKVSHILVQLLRLRQCCCHLSLMKEAVDQETFVNEGIDLTLEQQLREMSLQDNNQVTTPSNSDVTTPGNTDLSSKDAEKSSMFHCDKPSTKIQKVLGILANNKSKSTPEKPVKSVIVSQWTKMLDVIGWHLEHAGYKYVVIRGGVPPRQRMEAMEQFNRNPRGPEVLLVSLQAGGVGLNLIGGSHLFLLDMHWNPALEDQASDMIYRVGQKNNVVIHKFVCKDTVEEKIQDLQKAKKNLAQGVLSGGDVGKQKLSLADLRQLFGL